MEEKKEYTNPQIETIMIKLGDIVATSETPTPIDPVDPDPQQTEEVY